MPLRGAADVADALQALYEDEALRLRMGAAARERVMSDFALERQLDELTTMYEAVRNGVTTSIRPPAIAGGPAVRLLSVGRLSWTQGFDDAMQAVKMVRERGVDCRQRIFGEGPYLRALWFARHQLDLERHVGLRVGEGPRPDLYSAELDSPTGAAKLAACAQWHRQVEWADVLLDTSLRDPPQAALAAARAAGVETIGVAGNPGAIAELLFELATARGPRPVKRTAAVRAS